MRRPFFFQLSNDADGRPSEGTVFAAEMVGKPTCVADEDDATEPMIMLTSSSSSDENNSEDDSIDTQKEWRNALTDIGMKHSFSSLTHEKNQEKQVEDGPASSGVVVPLAALEDNDEREEDTPVSDGKSGLTIFEKIMCHVTMCGLDEAGTKIKELDAVSSTAKQEQAPSSVSNISSTTCNPLSALLAVTSNSKDEVVEASYDEQTMVTTIQQSFSSSDSSKKDEVTIEIVPGPHLSPKELVDTPSSVERKQLFRKSNRRAVGVVDTDTEKGQRNVSLFDELEMTMAKKFQQKIKRCCTGRKQRTRSLIFLVLLVIIIVVLALTTQGKDKPKTELIKTEATKFASTENNPKLPQTAHPTASPTTAVPSMSPTAAPTIFDPSQCGVRRRQSWRRMTCTEQNEFMNAIRLLKEDGLYDEFTKIHYDSADTSHLVDAFLPWHRWFLYSFETELQRVAGYCITLPYWDWEATPEDAMEFVFKSTTFGSERAGCVSDGLVDGWRSTGNGNGCVRREFNYDTRYIVSEEEILSRITNFENYEDFRTALEGSPHASIHYFVDGTLRDRYSPNDAVFYLHHVTVDRIWTLWQDYYEHDDVAWDPKNFGWTHYSGSDIDDPMTFNSVWWADLTNPMTGRYPTPREVLANQDSIINVQYVDDRLALLLQQTDRWYHNDHRERNQTWILPASSRGWPSLQEGCPGEEENNSGLCTTLGHECEADEDCCSGLCGKQSLCESICQRVGQKCTMDNDCCSGFCHVESGGWCDHDQVEDDSVMFLNSRKQARWEQLMDLNPDDPQFVFERMGSEDCERRITSETITTWPCHL